MAENREQGNTLYSIDPDGVEYRYVRDDNGRLVLFKDGDGYDYTYSYNEDGFQTSSGYPDGSSLEFTYDEEGHLASLVNPDMSSINFAYDDADNLVSQPLLLSCVRIEVQSSQVQFNSPPDMNEYTFKARGMCSLSSLVFTVSRR